ncbi:hypothetical protein [Sphingomonas sp. Leaf28]|uniref:hypothetical protein n=1 Tax=Sphingomonas sp. Leaf28 TaxID=1735695 RepID=UPI0006F9B92A|nr:hypothetical protein [Sphingomonas sp. Leaf28]KQN09075.1 hypothetical protein ASE79_14580 [Sphingomonas sp. Leaf28]
MSDGSAEWVKELDRMIAALEGPAIEEGMTAWTNQIVVPAARRLVPKLTRATERSIGAVAGPGGAVVFATTHYAPIIEFGGGTRMASPFLMPAILLSLPRLGEFIARAVFRRSM